MILQRDKIISIWGTTDINDKVTIHFQDKAYIAHTDSDGNWKAEVGPLQVSFDEEMVIACGDERIILADVQVGDVWFAGGQSNMEFHMRYDADYEEELTKCENSNIRFFDYPEVSYVGQMDEADYLKNYGKWRKADAENLEWFSAVGYYFAKEIQANQNVPVGIIGCNWGGTPACSWMDEESIKRGGGEIFLTEYQSTIENLDIEEYNQAFANNPGSWKLDPFADMFSDMMMRGYGVEEIMEKLTGQKVELKEEDFASFMPLIGPKYERRPIGLYDSMLTQVAPYGISGFLYYQGETDGDTHPECYETLFPALIECWRNLWKEKLPFLFVQLAPFGRWMTCDGVPYAIIRAAQQKTVDTVENTGMAVISDVGMEWDIHPKKKQPVGFRLALLAENKVYGQDVLCEAPTLTEAHFEGDCLILKFENVGTGLYLSDGDKTLSGVSLYLGQKKINLDEIAAEIKANTAILHGIENNGSDVNIIIGEGGWYTVNLYNSANIPARPVKVMI